MNTLVFYSTIALVIFTAIFMGADNSSAMAKCQQAETHDVCFQAIYR